MPFLFLEIRFEKKNLLMKSITIILLSFLFLIKTNNLKAQAVIYDKYVLMKEVVNGKTIYTNPSATKPDSTNFIEFNYERIDYKKGITSYNYIVPGSADVKNQVDVLPWDKTGYKKMTLNKNPLTIFTKERDSDYFVLTIKKGNQPAEEYYFKPFRSRNNDANEYKYFKY